MEIRKAPQKTTITPAVRIRASATMTRETATVSANAQQNPAAVADGEDTRFDDEFLASVSHELRTPLSAIMIWSTVLLNRTDLSPAVRDGLEEVKRGADEQQALVSALADFTRIRSGKLALTLAPTDLAAIVRAAVDTQKPGAEEKKIEITCTFGPDLGVVMADPHRLNQAVGNLVNNAVKFSDSGGRVTLTINREKEQVRIQVVDAGQGIAAEDLPRVLARFSARGGVAGRPQRGGLGLGLGIARHLVELHRGELAVTSRGLGQGAVFTVTLPLPVMEVPTPKGAARAG